MRISFLKNVWHFIRILFFLCFSFCPLPPLSLRIGFSFFFFFLFFFYFFFFLLFLKSTNSGSNSLYLVRKNISRNTFPTNYPSESCSRVFYSFLPSRNPYSLVWSHPASDKVLRAFGNSHLCGQLTPYSV